MQDRRYKVLLIAIGAVALGWACLFAIIALVAPVVRGGPAPALSVVPPASANSNPPLHGTPRAAGPRAQSTELATATFESLQGNTPTEHPTATATPPVSPTPRVLSSPQNLTHFSGRGQITLVWNRNKEPELAEYLVYIAPKAEGPYSFQAAVPRDASHYTFPATNGTTYYFKVSATAREPGTESRPAGPVNGVAGSNAPGPAKVETEGRLVKVNGAPFNPKGIKNAHINLGGAAAEGFNVVFAAYSPYVSAGISVDVLNHAQTLGIKIILSFVGDLLPNNDAAASAAGASRAQVLEARIKRVLNGVDNIKEHPALFGYFISDEPEYRLASEPDWPEQLATLRTRIKSADPNHVVLVDLTEEQHVQAFENIGDIVLFHRHVFVPANTPESGWDAGYASALAQIAEVSEMVASRVTGKPFWASSFAYGNYASSTGNTPRPPTPDEYTSVFYQWLIGGATGFIAYTYQIPGYWLLPSSDLLPPEKQLYPGARFGSQALWQRMGALNGEQDLLKPILQAAGPRKEVTLSPAYAAGIRAMGSETGGKVTVISVNTLPTHQSGASLSISGGGNWAVRVLFENRTLKASGGLWEDDFAPYARHVYELVPAP